MSILLFDSFYFFLCTKAVQILVCVTTTDMYSCTIHPLSWLAGVVSSLTIKSVAEVRHPGAAGGVLRVFCSAQAMGRWKWLGSKGGLSLCSSNVGLWQAPLALRPSGDLEPSALGLC